MTDRNTMIVLVIWCPRCMKNTAVYEAENADPKMMGESIQNAAKMKYEIALVTGAVTIGGGCTCK